MSCISKTVSVCVYQYTCLSVCLSLSLYCHLCTADASVHKLSIRTANTAGWQNGNCSAPAWWSMSEVCITINSFVCLCAFIYTLLHSFVVILLPLLLFWHHWLSVDAHFHGGDIFQTWNMSPPWKCHFISFQRFSLKHLLTTSWLRWMWTMPLSEVCGSDVLIDASWAVSSGCVQNDDRISLWWQLQSHILLTQWLLRKVMLRSRFVRMPLQTGFPRILESHWKYFNFFLLNSRPWKYLKRGQVLESP